MDVDAWWRGTVPLGPGVLVAGVAIALLAVAVAVLRSRAARLGDSYAEPVPTQPLSYFTTACNAFVTALNPSGGLQGKTVMVVLSGPPHQETAAVYRRSGSTPGKFSVDRYTLEGGGWSRPQKDPGKFDDPPHPPPGTVEEVVDGIQCWTVGQMTLEQKQRVSELIKIRRRRA